MKHHFPRAASRLVRGMVQGGPSPVGLAVHKVRLLLGEKGTRSNVQSGSVFFAGYPHKMVGNPVQNGWVVRYTKRFI